MSDYLEKVHIHPTKLTGNVPIAERQTRVNHFNSCPEPRVFLLSLKAGGVGLTLTGANHLILLDSHWNPAPIKQDTDLYVDAESGCNLEQTLENMIVMNML